MAALALAGLVLAAVAALRSAEYDEQYTLFLTAGTARPIWPAVPLSAGKARALQDGDATMAGIARDLRASDVHPPLYFWALAAWRRLAGHGLFAARLFSVGCSLGALAAVATIAARVGVPPALAVLLTLGCYGFAYTGAIARGFALAQMLTLCGVAAALGAVRSRKWIAAVLAGTLLGAATFANYLAGFVAGGVLLFLMRGSFRRSTVPIAAFAFSLWLPFDLWFFLAQRDSRPGQFPPFHLIEAAPRLAKFLVANIFGALPLYASGLLSASVGFAIAGLAVALSAVVIRGWSSIGTPYYRLILAVGAAAPAIGLLLLGAAFNNTPIELRYLSFGAPFAAVLLAGAINSLKLRVRITMLGVLSIFQTASLVGLAVAQPTMQPARATILAAAALIRDGVLLIPHGSDGVGIVGAVANEAPPSLPILVIREGESAAAIRSRTQGFSRVLLALIEQDEASRAAAPVMLAAFQTRCWRRAADGFNVVVFERVCEGE
ncbi:MAG: glycosyltransferase family 39 protein [Acetobacteraceae bacterium]|nr:glycosyltransferase family 39 protein [Acetobacteraceae bacterium]